MIVETTLGKVEGIVNEGIEQYLGIPYAKPPVGELRFKPPVEFEPWEGVRECKKYGSAGPQLYVEGLSKFRGEGELPLSESNLYLNVTTPKADDNKRPVLFWIHGGAFQKASATMGMNELSFAKEGLVVVNCNYRLGVFGFVDFSEYLGEEYKESGNSGILDIIMALKWAKKNVARFGGDPDNITIAGQSAGAKICGFLTCTAKTRGLFNRAVLLSGAIQCLRDTKTARKVAEMFMNDAGLTKENAHKLLEMPWEEIVENQKKLFAGLNLHTVGAEFDGVTFLGRNSLDTVLDKSGHNVPMMIGINRDELDLYWHVYNFHELDDYMAQRLFGDYGPVVKEDLDEQLKGLDKNSEEYHRAFVYWTTEYIYRAGSNQLAAAAADAGEPVYLFTNNWDDNIRKTKNGDVHHLSCHMSETQFIFGGGNVQGPDTPAHRTQAERMHNSVLNFIKNGKPTAEGMPEWPEFNSDTRLQMVFNGEDSHVERSPLPQTSPKMPHQVFWLH